MAITVISVEQGSAGDTSAAMVTPTLLKSKFNKAPYVFKHLWVPNTDQSDMGRIPAALIRDYTATISGPKILLGNSTGNQYLNLAIRSGYFDGYPADELTFWMLANPERKYGGWCRVPSPTELATWDISMFGPPGTPEDIPWQVHDFAQRYDICADNATVINPGALYKMYRDSVGLALHLNYFTVGPDDKNWWTGKPVTLKYVEGNFTYYLYSPTIDAGFEQSYIRPAWS